MAVEKALNPMPSGDMEYTDDIVTEIVVETDGNTGETTIGISEMPESEALVPHDANIAEILDNHIDIVLVGDSLGSVLYNYNSTRKVNLNMMIEHTKSVRMGIRKSLLVIDLPYNTYKNYGLTPTPINNPGLDAINAALYPPITSYMFFVADGTGTHTFNVNNEGHNKSKKNVTRKSK